MWTDGENEHSANIHWGYQEGDTFNEFTDTASLDSNAASMSLDLIFDGYMYGSAIYKKGSTEYSLASDTLKKVTGEGDAITIGCSLCKRNFMRIDFKYLITNTSIEYRVEI